MIRYYLYYFIIFGDTEDFNKLNDLLLKILKPYKRFKVHFDTLYTLSSNNKNQYLNVEEKGYINGLVRNLNEDLKLAPSKINIFIIIIDIKKIINDFL